MTSMLAAALCLFWPPAAVAGEVPDDDPRVTPVVRAVRKAGPAVVNISTTRMITDRWGMRGDIFDEIFPRSPVPSPFDRRVKVTSLGSGCVIHPDGYIVTNAHVVRRAQSISVSFDDETRHDARLIAADAGGDLAVIRIDPPDDQPLPYLPLARSDDLMVGETVIAVGNPLGYRSSVTKGIVSAVERTLNFRGGVTYGGLIQTDAPINEGNSGGALLNIKGEFIGLTTAIRADAQNIGFAISSETIAARLPQLLDAERMRRLVFGAEVRPGKGDDHYKVRVVSVREGTPAARRLRPGDRIVAVGGTRVQRIADYVFAMLLVEAPSDLMMVVERGGETLDLAVPIKVRPKPDGKQLARGMTGLTLREITPELARDLSLPSAWGLLVVGVEEHSPGHRIGVRAGDILFQLGEAHVKDLDTLGRLLEDVDGGELIRIGILRGSTAALTQIRLREAPAAEPTEESTPAAPSEPVGHDDKGIGI
ncbi:MAG: PDZ domain-containing protein [Planctomycetes bacterium]|nr:PDZ domain-containing protein [Planctomycetota bacterium]